MSKLEVSPRMTIRKGKLEEFKRQAAESIRQTKEKDTKTLRYDWFLSVMRPSARSVRSMKARMV